jgi:hypothetical protein
VALRTGDGTLSRRNLESQAPSVAQAEKIVSEASEGEMRLMDSNEAASRLREQLGLASHTHRQAPDDAKQSVQTVGRRKSSRPGQRRPERDAVGKPGTTHAAHA